MRAPALLLGTLAAVALLGGGCGDDGLSSARDVEVDADADAEVDADAQVDASADGEADADPDASADGEADADPDTGADAGPMLDLPDGGEGDPTPATGTLGGDRPAPYWLPEGYDAEAEARPIVFLLHGYSATGPLQDLYLGFHQRATDAGFVAVVPTGTTDATGVHFWNSDPAWCCNFYGSDVDDEGYLLGLVEEARLRFHLDPERVYFLGHSNGGFMAHRMACEHADVVAGAVSIAGSLPASADACAPTRPVTILQVHGTLDAVVSYLGGAGGAYPGAEAVASRWAALDGCDALPVPSVGYDYDAAVFGPETTLRVWDGCDEGVLVSRWRLTGSGHVPVFTEAFLPDVFTFLLSHRRAPAR